MSRWITSVAIVCAMAVTGSLLAQGEAKDNGKGRAGPGGRGFGAGAGMLGGPTKMSLVNIPQVQTELKLTDEQKTKIADLEKGLRTTMPNTQGMSQDERRKAFEEARTKREKASAEAEKTLATILNADQTKRLSEITIQQKGVQALKDEAVVKELKITAEQTAKIDEAIKAGQAEQQKLMQEGRGARGDANARTAMQEKMTKLRQDTEAKAIEALNADQKAAFAKMKGTAFKLERQAGQPGGRGGRGGAGGKAAGGKTTST